MMLFKMPIGINLFPWIATITLPPIQVSTFLMAAFLANLSESVSPKNPNNVFGIAGGKALAHGKPTSRTFAPAGKETAEGSNHNSKASFAFWSASSSVSPADAHPGISGKKAE
jgi:hypothetical protein